MFFILPINVSCSSRAIYRSIEQKCDRAGDIARWVPLPIQEPHPLRHPRRDPSERVLSGNDENTRPRRQAIRADRD